MRSPNGELPVLVPIWEESVHLKEKANDAYVTVLRIAILRGQEPGNPTADVCRQHGVSSATIFEWKVKYGDLDASDAKRLSREPESILVQNAVRLTQMKNRPGFSPDRLPSLTRQPIFGA